MRHLWKYGLKEQNWEKLKFQLERSIIGDLRLSALALARPSKPRNDYNCVRAPKKRIDRSAIKHTYT
jgi:hypothetical protein